MRKLFAALRMNLFLLLALSLIAGCGTGGLSDPPATSTGGGTTGGTTGTTPVVTPAKLDLLVSSTQLKSDMVGAPTVTLTAIVKDSGNRALKGQAVAFSADSGVLGSISGTTDDNGMATAKLGASGDPTYRTINVWATAGSVSGANAIAVTGTQIGIDPADFSLPFNDSTGKQLVISLKDSEGNAILGKTVSLTAASQSTFSAASYVTNNSGQITVTVKNATDTVGDTITASAIGVSSQAALTINTAKLVISAPAAAAKVPINTLQAFNVTYTKNGNPPVPEQTIYFTTTRGTLTAFSRTTVGGSASVNISSANSGPAILTAYTTDGTAQVSTQAAIVFVTNMAAKMALSASPAVINTNAPGLSSEQSMIKAIVRDASDNLVMGKAVDFSIIQDASAGALAKASATTDMYGTATTSYIAGSVTGGAYNVVIRATVQDTPAVTATTTLTVGGQALFIALGTGPEIQSLTPNRYQKDYVALVTDAGGRAVANAAVTATVTPQYYLKGFYYICGTGTASQWCQMTTLVPSKSTMSLVPACMSEDRITQNPLYDYNGVLDPGEDQNANSRLDPGNVVSVTATPTDSTGHSTVSLVYAKDFAMWANVRLEVRASLAGSTASDSQGFNLPGLAKDYTDTKVDPPGNPSPFGSNTTCYAALSVIALDPTKISLNWDPSAYAASYNIYRDQNQSPPVEVLISNVTKTTYQDTVAAGPTYCYEIKQVSASGVESPLSPTGNRVCVGSQSVAPASVTATTLSPTQIQVSWADAGAATYRIYQNDIPLQYSVTRSVVSGNLSANTQYCYAVSSVNSEGIESTKSSTVCATTQLSPPAIPTGLRANATSDSQIATLWTASAGAAGYRVYRDGIKLSDAAAAALADAGLTAGTRYCYAVTAYDAAGNESAQTAQVCATTQPAPPPVPPPVPTGLTATAVSQSQINLSWTAVTDATGYSLYRGGTYWTTVAGTTASDTGLIASTPYCYTITSVSSSGGASAQSSSVCVTTPSPPPPVPTGLTVTPVSASQLNIAWAASVGATGYKVYRGGVLLTSPIATNLADTGLSSGTTYCYTVSAVNATGSESATATQACAATNTIAVPTNMTVTAATSSQINLTWTASVGAAGYRIYKNGAYLKDTVATSASDTGLTASTTYCYSVSAFDVANNESVKTSQLCATTYGPPPTVPAGVAASAVTTTRVDLSWTASSGALQYKVYRNGALLGTTATASYSDTTAAANVPYIYTVTAIDATGSESSQSTQSAAHTGLTVPSAFTVTVISKTQINVSWTNSGGVNGTGYKLYRDGALRQPVTATSFTDTGLTPDSRYCYSVSSTDAAGNESAKSSQICATTTNAAPGNPTGLIVTATSDSQIAVSWTASAGAAGYRIYRDGTKLNDATATTLADTGLTSSTQYCYAVSAYDAAGNESAQTAQLCATTQPTPPPVPPPVPTGLTATAVSQSQINLSWTAATGAAGYALYRGGTYWTTVAGTTASDTGLIASTPYCYTITSVSSSGGASAQSSSVCVTTPSPPPPVPTGLTVTPASASQLNIAWTGSVLATGYKVYRGGVLLTSTIAPTTTLADTGLSSGTTYCYMISAVNATGSESATCAQACAATNTIAVPTNLSVTAATSSQINFTWTASAGAAGYRIYKNGAYLKSVSLTPTSASDTGLTASTTYCYSISAFDVANNESARTSQLCATTYGPPPADPGNLTTFVSTPATVILNWSASVGATGYYIYRNGVNLNPLAPVTGTTYTDTLATANGQNIYKVTAIDATGSESSGVSNQVTISTALTVPTMVSATANTSAQITIVWANAGAGTGVAGYKIYRDGILVKTILSAATLTYADSTGLSASTQYCYRVSAIDASAPAKESAQSSASFCATTYPATGSIALSLKKSSDLSTTTSVSIDSPAKLTATVKDSAGSAIVGAVVSFSTISDLSFNPASGTALTDATGKATITVNAGNTTGATTISAATTDAFGTAISGSINLSVAPPNLSLSVLTITPAGPLSAGGSAGVSITVNDLSSGTPFTTSVPISFTSDGVQAGKATITPQVYTVNGVASATYRDINYATIAAADDTITATLTIGGTTFTKTGTITVNPASAGSISFISATPANIALKGTGGTGRSETSVVVFKVLGTNGNPISGKTVNFSLNTTVGGLALTAASAVSGGDGFVQTIVQAGTVSTPVRVSATIDTTTISTTSDQLVISTGIPAQNAFSIAVSTHNIEAWDYDGITSDITVRLADHFNNPAPDGTAVYFRSSGGSIQPSCTTVAGTCKVTFTSQAPRPTTPTSSKSGRVVILAYALGEESFVDLNGNGIFDTTIPDTFTDMPEPFLDANENGVRNATEEFVDTNTDGLYSPGDGVFNGILRDASIVGPKTIHVRNSSTVVLSGSDAVIKIDGTTSPPALTFTPCLTTALFTPGESLSFDVVVADVNGNVMPADTTISFSTTNGTIINTAPSYTVPSTSAAPPTYSVTIQSDATQSGGPPPAGTAYTCSNTKATGVFTVTVSTPKGIKSYQYMTVND